MNFVHPDIQVGPLESAEVAGMFGIEVNAEYDPVNNIIRFGTDWQPDAWREYCYPGIETEFEVIVSALAHEINHSLLLQFIDEGNYSLKSATMWLDEVTYNKVWEGGIRL